MTRRFEGRVALVTGGAEGIGACIAEGFAAEGARVVIADVNEAAGRRRAEVLRRKRYPAEFIRTDVGVPGDVTRMVKTAVERFERLDILVNNTGIGSSASFADRATADWDRVLNVNLRGAYLAAQAAAPHLAKRRGAIVNIASSRALQSEPDTEPYSASKGGLLALTHSLAVTLSGKVRVNCVLPGWIVTDRWRFDRRKTAVTKSDAAQHPAGRVGKPEDIANACLFLCSEAAGFITGAQLVVDGGMTRKMIYRE